MSNEQLTGTTEDGRIPERLPVLPLVGAVVFPHILIQLAVTEAPVIKVVGAAAVGAWWRRRLCKPLPRMASWSSG